MQHTRYLPFGGYRAGSGPNEVTDHAYTSQRENMEIGLYDYNARYYAPTLARFLSPDTLIPDPANPQAFNRYSYVENRPLNFNDPTGHFTEDAIYQYILNSECGGSYNCADQMLDDWMVDGAWWLMLLAASADDILYGMDWDSAGSFKFIGSGMEQLNGIVTHGGLGVQIRLSELYAGSYSIPHIIDGSGQIAHNIPSWSYSADWEALWFHETGQVLLREDFAAGASSVIRIFGNQYIPPTVGSVFRAAVISGVEEALVSTGCKLVGELICEVGYSAGKAALEQFIPPGPEQHDFIRNTNHWEFWYRPDMDALTVSVGPGGELHYSGQALPPIISPR